MKINIKYISKRFAALALVGSLALSSAGCGQNKKESTTTNGIENTIEDNIDELYLEVSKMENDIVDFSTNSLPNGFVDVNESNCEEMADMFTNAYLVMNINDLEKETFAILDQDGDLIKSNMQNDFQSFTEYVLNYMGIVTPETNLDYSKFIKEEDDMEFINDLSFKIAEFNVCIDAESRKQKLAEINNIKDSFLNVDTNTKYNATTLYLAVKMIIECDAIAKAYGLELFSSEEEFVQIYTTYYNAVCDDQVTSGQINADDISNAVYASNTSFESMSMTEIGHLIEDVLAKTDKFDDNKYDSYYSFNETTSRIAEKIKNLYIAPEMTYIDKENEIRRATSDAIDAMNIGKSTTKMVDSKDVPEQYREKDIENTIDYETNKSTTADYERGKAAGRTQGSTDARAKFHSNYVIPSNISSCGSVPSGKSSEYIRGYKDGYVAGWNTYVNSARQSYNSTTETQTIPVAPSDQTTEVNTPSISDRPSQPTTEEPTEEYIPVPDGPETETVIDEGIVTSQTLRKYRDELFAAYIDSYMNEFFEEENVKRI